MSTTTKLSTFGIPAIFGIGIALITIQIMKSEKQLINRELELKIQLNKF